MVKSAVVVFGCALALAAGAQAQTDGQRIFEGKGNCWTCHGKNARGTPLGPDLTDGEWLNIDGSLDSIRAVVQRGVAQPRQYPAPMPALGGAKLNKEEIDAVAAYVYGLRGGARPPGAGVMTATKRNEPASASMACNSPGAKTAASPAPSTASESAPEKRPRPSITCTTTVDSLRCGGTRCPGSR